MVAFIAFGVVNNTPIRCYCDFIYIYNLAVFRKAENAFFNALAVFLQFYIFIDITLLTLL